MKKTRYSDEQIVRILREADRDSVAEVAKRHGVSEATIYVWRKKFGSMETDEVKRLKALEAENARLRKLLVDRELEIDVMKEINSKNGRRTGSSGAGEVRHLSWRLPASGLCADGCFPFRFVLHAEDAYEGCPGD